MAHKAKLFTAWPFTVSSLTLLYFISTLAPDTFLPCLCHFALLHSMPCWTSYRSSDNTMLSFICSFVHVVPAVLLCYSTSYLTGLSLFFAPFEPHSFRYCFLYRASLTEPWNLTQLPWACAPTELCTFSDVRLNTANNCFCLL